MVDPTLLFAIFFVIFFLVDQWSDLTRLRKMASKIDLLEFQLQIHRKETFRRSEMLAWLNQHELESHEEDEKS